MLKWAGKISARMCIYFDTFWQILPCALKFEDVLNIKITQTIFMNKNKFYETTTWIILNLLELSQKIAIWIFNPKSEG
jgi:hypothetical protein